MQIGKKIVSIEHLISVKENGIILKSKNTYHSHGSKFVDNLTISGALRLLKRGKLFERLL